MSQLRGEIAPLVRYLIHTEDHVSVYQSSHCVQNNRAVCQYPGRDSVHTELTEIILLHPPPPPPGVPPWEIKAT